MILGLLMLFGYCFLMWLIFFKLKLAKFGIPQAVIGVFVGVHLLIIFLIGLRFMAPLATEARIVQYTVQLIPRLPEPTLVTAVLVQPNVAGQEGAAAVPVRPPALRIQGPAAGGPAGQGQAERAGAAGRYADLCAEGGQAAGRPGLCAVPAEALRRPCRQGRRAPGGCTEVDGAGGGGRSCHQGGPGRSGARQPQLHIQHQRL
jgi:hypothetical protein